jgi:hypothetical protein
MSDEVCRPGFPLPPQPCTHRAPQTVVEVLMQCERKLNRVLAVVSESDGGTCPPCPRAHLRLELTWLQMPA